MRKKYNNGRQPHDTQQSKKGHRKSKKGGEIFRDGGRTHSGGVGLPSKTARKPALRRKKKTMGKTLAHDGKGGQIRTTII